MSDRRNTGPDAGAAAPRQHAMRTQTPVSDPTKARRIELILRQIDSLPTLPAIATRLLALTTSDRSDARQVVEMIRSDQALTARVLSLCRRADMGLREEGMTIDKAVVMLGFNAVRNAVLSISVFEFFESPEDAADLPAHIAGADRSGAPPVRFDRKGLWRHSLAVAVAAEAIANAHPAAGLDAGEAFVCGLMHDIGKLAIDHVLPKSFARVVELVELNQGNIAEFERRIVGIDHHTAGKRLAEQWQLPYAIQDCIWLHGSSFEMLPKLDHRRMIGLVSLADIIVRRAHLGYSGNFTFVHDPDPLVRALGLDALKVEQATRGLHEELERRCRDMGLEDHPSQELFIQSIQQANQMLGRLNTALDRRSRAAARQSQLLDGITAFHSGAVPGRGVEDVMNAVVSSAISVLGVGNYAMLYQGSDSEPWLMSQYDGEANPVRSQLVEPPPQAPRLASMDASQPASLNLMGIMPWVADYLADCGDLTQLRVLPLGCGWGTAALLLHDRPVLPPWRELQGLASSWGAAIAAAGQHEGARRLGEELAEANRALAAAQDRLLQSESMARVGEMAAGAAHEMNNPLAVISGRSQLLAQTLQPGSKQQLAARTIVDQVERLTGLISSLSLFADPPRAQRRPTEVPRLVDDTVKRVQADYPVEQRQGLSIDVQVLTRPPMLMVDPDHLRQALSDLLHNAMQASPRSYVRVSLRLSEPERLLTIEVADDGAGMDAHTLEHAMDPFFSAKPAGRRMGMGLPRARQLAAAHGGNVELRSILGQGTTAVLTLRYEPVH